MLKFLKNTQIRLLFSGSLFTGAFIWMAITSYDVNEQEIQVFAIFSVLLLILMIGAGSVLAVFLFLIRRRSKKGGLLGEIETIERETAKMSAETAAPIDSKGNTKGNANGNSNGNANGTNKDNTGANTGVAGEKTQG